ncbi:dsDNA nuclease domain-containing protein [Salinarimonas ramus]|uniref:CD-NTase associated protein 4-like DNA endonuclease domain-containing protein n=1 Tax=Salinarimonas ramus TaxID=690164 RepID=A0A917Q637_9HYPH|nr:dsDNA nuclease domain-containing protein [Salinarimonas ramus]GGK28566.1 hypothetical protein GCM10011322_13760 [Salinarimonas ramus]
MDLLESLTSVPQREKGGSTALERLDFQTCWGVSHLLTLHQAGKGYAVAFEFHDDILVLDDATSPTEIRCYQLKTAKSGKWTVKKLTARKKTDGIADQSISGKMYDSRLKFGDYVVALGFVSNQVCDFIAESKYPCSFQEAEKSALASFVKALESEVSGFTSDEARLFEYHYTDLSLTSFEETLLGRVVNFVIDECALTHCNHKGFYLALVDQCRRRSKNLKDLASSEDLLAGKFVTRQHMSQWLSDLHLKTSARPQWDVIVGELVGVPPMEKRALKAQWDLYATNKLARPELSAVQFSEAVRRITDELGRQPSSTLPQLLGAALPKLKAYASQAGLKFGDDYLRAAFLYEFYAP